MDQKLVFEQKPNIVLEMYLRVAKDIQYTIAVDMIEDILESREGADAGFFTICRCNRSR